MQPDNIRIFIAAVFILLSGTCQSHGRQTVSEPDTIMAPPFLAHSSRFMMALFHLKAEKVNKLLPEGIVAIENKDGMVTATFEMYETDRIYGLPNYKVAFIVVDVSGHNSRDDTPGHFAVWGNTDSKAASEYFYSHFGLPFSYTEHMTLKTDGKKYTGTIGLQGEEKIRIGLEILPGQPFSGSGIVNMVGKTEDGIIAISEVLWLSNGYNGYLQTFDVDPQGRSCSGINERCCSFLDDDKH
ncbi:MAG: hypothetical protein PVF73_01405 [Bacteroidales bacterium]